MPIVNIIKRASNYILGNEDEYDDECDLGIYEDNEVLFCKNNICVHPPAFARQESDILHYPGYLTVTTKTFIDQYNNAKRPTLLLTWIPNATLRKCPSTVENSLGHYHHHHHNHHNHHNHHQNHLNQQNNHSNRQQSTEELKQNRLFNNYQQKIIDGSEIGNGGSGGGVGGVEGNDNGVGGGIFGIVDYPQHQQNQQPIPVALLNGTPNTNPFLEPYYYNSPLADKKNLLHEHVGTATGLDNLDTISCSSSSGKGSMCNSISTQSCRIDTDCGGAGNSSSGGGGGGGGGGGIITSIGSEHLPMNNFMSVEDEEVFIASAAVERKQQEQQKHQEEEQQQQTTKEDNEEQLQLQRELQPLLSSDEQNLDTPTTTTATNIHQTKMKPLLNLHQQQSVTSVNITIANPRIQNHDISPTESIKQQNLHHQTSVGGGDDKFLRTLSVSSVDDTSPNWMTPELFAYKHNLAFPESATASPIVARKTTTTTSATPLKCRRFSVDLSQMRSLRLFFNDENCTSGQLVIASRESQYKILHFHHGGLDHLAQVLHQWHCLLHNIKLAPGHDEPNLPYRQFMVCRPEVKKSELHPDEDNVNKITTDYFYGTLLNERGQIEDDLLLRKCVFFGGLEKSLRKTVWPFLLHCYSFGSSFEDRALLMDIRRQEYEAISRRRLYSMSPEEQASFWRTVQCVIEKDVVRTDRGNPYFAGEDNPNIDIMKNVLLNYAYYNPGLSYTQGMSDLLAPVLCEIKNESETFWCFVGLMQRAIFVCTPTDNDIDKNLSYLRELIRIMVPKFYTHLEKHADSMELLFCHRWILLCFKREFTEPVAIRMWEACWSNYLTDYFHLFLCLAIIAVYADDVIAQDLRTDEMLLHFSSLAMYMDGQLILRKARGLLHQFRQLQRIPCTLSGLCKRCGPGMWDSGHHPAIECIGHTDEEHCSLAVD